MDDGHHWMYIFLFIAFIIIDIMYFGFGSAIQNSNSNQLQKDMELGDIKAGRVLHIVNRPGKFVNAIQLVSILLGYITGGILLIGFIKMLSFEISWGLNLTIGTIIEYILVYIIALILMVSFGIVIPKRLAARNPKEWAYATVNFIRSTMFILAPVIWILNGLSFIVLKLIGIDMYKLEDNVTEEDIMSMVNEGHEQGVLESSEAEMITNIFQLNDKDAEDVMIHRKNLVALDGDEMLSNVVDFMLNEGKNSRYPVYNKEIDNIIGILNLKDALIYVNKKDYKDKPLSQIPGILREAHFIPETRNLDSLFKEMQLKKMHMVIVVDEYGQTAGIVTMEDILEEIVGNIMDEYDVDEEMITVLPDGSFIINGMTPLSEVGDAIDIEFSEEELDDFDTLNGFLISQLDRIPSDGEQFDIVSHGYIFTGIQVENKIIKIVNVVRVVINNDDGIGDNTASNNIEN